MLNYLTIDVEDYYHVSAFEHTVGHKKWDHYTSRIERNVRIILDILEDKNIQGTFFVLGWIAEKYPELVKDIHNRGHEIGCHSYYHRLIYNLTPEEFREDTRRAKDILEQIIGCKVSGYRAPSYSLTKNSMWALDILQELGFKYDSSIFPVYHDRYGIPEAPRFKYILPDNDLTEYPISTSLIFGKKVPVAGGGYFRLFPYAVTKYLLEKINQKENQPFIFYIHPWEIDPEQPRINGAGIISRFRHYNNLSRTLERFRRLLEDFDFRPIKDTNS